MAWEASHLRVLTSAMAPVLSSWSLPELSVYVILAHLEQQEIFTSEYQGL